MRPTVKHKKNCVWVQDRYRSCMAKKNRSSKGFAGILTLAALAVVAIMGVSRARGTASQPLPSASISARTDLSLPALDREVAKLAAQARTHSDR